MSKRESTFQANLRKKDLLIRYPGCVVTKNDPKQVQGIPDLTVFYKGKAAWLEDKADKDAEHQPNQDYYIEKANSDGAFGRFIYPENKEEVLNELDRFFGI